MILLVLACLFTVFVMKLNDVEKTELVVRDGQTFEKAEVMEILQDNMQDNGTRVGEQRVKVRMLTGEKKGKNWRSPAARASCSALPVKWGCR